MTLYKVYEYWRESSEGKYKGALTYYVDQHIAENDFGRRNKTNRHVEEYKIANKEFMLENILQTDKMRVILSQP